MMRAPVLIAALGALVLSTVPATAAAQSAPAEIYGRVVDDTGTGIAGVVIDLAGTGPGSTARLQATTRSDGWWKLGELSEGTYVITETQPEGYADGPDTAGTAGGTLQPPDSIAGIDLRRGQRAIGYEFSEIATVS